MAWHNAEGVSGPNDSYPISSSFAFRLLFAQLGQTDLSVDFTAFHKLVMGTQARHGSVVQDQDAVCRLHGASRCETIRTVIPVFHL